MAENEKLKAINTEIRENDIDLGTVRIADEVVAMIAGYAAREVDGVAEMAGNSSSNPFNLSSYKKQNKGIRVDVSEGIVRVDVALILHYGFNIPTTSSKVQTRIKQAIENMTGLSVQDVNVRIAGIQMPNSEEQN